MSVRTVWNILSPRTAAGLPSGSAVVLLSLLATALQAQSAERPITVLDQAGIEQRLGEKVPMELRFRDENGTSVSLRSFFEKKKPVLLTLVYYECPMLCNEVLNGVLRASRAMEFRAGREFEIVTLSFNADDTPEQAAEKKREILASLGRPGAEEGWHFLTGDDRAVRELADAVGFHFAYDAETGLFAHAAGIMLLTPEGKVSRYFYGVEYAPRDLRLAVIEAAEEKLGTVTDQVLLYCFQYDPKTGKYSLLIMRVIRVLGLLTVAVLVGLMFFLRRSGERVPDGSSVAGASAKLTVSPGEREN